MPESLSHMVFVKRIVDYIQTIPQDFVQNLLCAELPGFKSGSPKVIGGSVPDVFYSDENTIVIGEAKTDNDIDNPHMSKQLDDYINEARTYNAQRHIVLCTSIIAYARLKNMIVLKKRREDITDISFHVLDNFERTEIV